MPTLDPPPQIRPCLFSYKSDKRSEIVRLGEYVNASYLYVVLFTYFGIKI
jgi:hypothetical protein